VDSILLLEVRRFKFMSLLKQIDDKGAVLEWSPIAKCPNLVALGTKVCIFRQSACL
jgi:hypothetical protein